MNLNSFERAAQAVERVAFPANFAELDCFKQARQKLDERNTAASQILATLAADKAERTIAYRNMLSRFDWSFEMSDCGTTRRAGWSVLQRLVDDQRELDADFSIWNAYCPVQCRDGRSYA